MNGKSWVLIIVALACGLGASMFASRLMQSNAGKVAEHPLETVQVVAARRSIRAGDTTGTTTEMLNKYFKHVRYIKGDEPKNAITSFEQLKGKIVRRSLAADQAVKSSDLEEYKAWHKLSDLSALGLRAMAIGVYALPGEGGFVIPGVRVDVVSMMQLNDKLELAAVEQNLLLLAVELSAHANSDGSVPVTVAVTPQQAVKLATAAEKSKLILVLTRLDEE